MASVEFKFRRENGEILIVSAAGSVQPAEYFTPATVTDLHVDCFEADDSMGMPVVGLEDFTDHEWERIEDAAAEELAGAAAEVRRAV